MTTPDPDLTHLAARRGLTVPAEDHDALVEYWHRIRALRNAVDESLLAHHEIALTWTAAGAEHNTDVD